MADGDPYSLWELDDWDSGAYYSYRGPIVTLDQPYIMDTIAFTAGPNQKNDFNAVRVRAWNGEENEPQIINGRLTVREGLDKNGKKYYEFLADKPFEADKIQLNTAVPSSTRYISCLLYTSRCV